MWKLGFERAIPGTGVPCAQPRQAEGCEVCRSGLGSQWVPCHTVLSLGFFFFCLVSLIFSKLESVSKLAYKVFHLEIPEGDCILHCDY